MRVSTACTACRSRRRKCKVRDHSSGCIYCAERNLPCSRRAVLSLIAPFNPHRSPSINPISPNQSLASLEDRRSRKPLLSTGLPSQQICLELVQLYFDFVHNQFHSIFHPPSFIEDVKSGRAPPGILYAMMALSARFSTNPVFAGIPPCQRGNAYAKESTLLLDLRDVSLTTIQTCVLLGTMCITEGEAAAESVYYSTASRIAQLLDLARRPTSSALEKEVNIRVWWTLCMIDVWCSTGVGLPRMMVHQDDIPLPIDETTFLSLQPGDTAQEHSQLDTNRNSSLLAQMIKLNRILLEVNDTIKETVNGGSDAIVVEEKVLQLSSKLDRWYDDLPINMHDTPGNLAYWASQGLGRFFVAVYLGYYHFGQLLFYQFLHEDCHSSLSKAHHYATKCKSHASALCQIVYAANSTPGCSVLYTMVGHILVIASSIQIHTLLFSSSEAEIRVARGRLERNFETLSQLREYWPTLDVSFSRLRTFHEVCKGNMDESFRMDRWMLKFLSEFAKTLDGMELKEAREAANELEFIDVAHIGISPRNWA